MGWARPLPRAAAVALVLALCGAAPSHSAAADDTGGINPGELRRAIGLAGSNDDETNIAFRLGAAFDLSGPGSHGPEELNAVRLAAAQIRAAGGPNILLTIEDIGTAGAWKGTAAETALHASATPIILVGGAGAGGTMLAGLAGDHILALDGDLGVPGTARAQPYLWGLRANTPDDDFAVGLQYVIAANPKARTVMLLYPQVQTVGPTPPKTFSLALADDGLTLTSAIAEPATAIDEPSLTAALKQQHPDAVYVDRIDPAGALRAAHAAGYDGPVIGTDEVADSSSQLAGYIVATDWFDAARPSNDWARLFVASYRNRFGTEPGTAAANAYEDTFAVWTLIRRVLARGGDISSGARLQQELAANPAFKSIYGGDGTELDEIRLDPTTHAVLERPFAVFQIEASGRRRLATSDMGGANFALDRP